MTTFSAALAAVALAATAATTPTPTPTPAPAPPSIAQLCAATGIDEVDDLLADLAATDLVGELSPLVTLLVPESESVELDASVQLEDVRERLNCAPAPGPAPGDGDEDGDTDTDDDGDGDGFTQVDDLPVGAADTGGGPAT